MYFNVPQRIKMHKFLFPLFQHRNDMLEHRVEHRENSARCCQQKGAVGITSTVQNERKSQIEVCHKQTQVWSVLL